MWLGQPQPRFSNGNEMAVNWLPNLNNDEKLSNWYWHNKFTLFYERLDQMWLYMKYTIAQYSKVQSSTTTVHTSITHCTQKLVTAIEKTISKHSEHVQLSVVYHSAHLADHKIIYKLSAELR